MLKKHTIRAYDQELGRLKSLVLDMGRLAGSQIREAVQALEGRDAALAKAVVAQDRQVNQMEAQTGDLALRLLARLQPVGVDLRFIVASLKMASELERIADYAANLAKRIANLGNGRLKETISALAEMGRLSLSMLEEVMAAYDQADVDRAMAVWRRDDEIDRLYFDSLGQLRDRMASEPDSVAACTALLSAARSLERVGDHITNLAEEIHFLVLGQPFPKPD